MAALRAERLLYLAVGGLAVFVGVQVNHERTHWNFAPDDSYSESEPVRRDVSEPPPGYRAVEVRQPDVTSTTVSTKSILAPPDRDAAQINARIALSSGTYMADMLADLKNTLIRWPDRTDQGLRVWVQSVTTVPDWDTRYAEMAREAFADWSGDGLPIRFDFVLDSAS